MDDHNPQIASYDLSVITVCLNVLPDLKATVETVLAHKAKTPLRIEHVVVDGASTDGSLEYVRQLHEAGQVEVYLSEPDKGIYDAMNKGIRLSHGKVLLFLNAGDTFLPEADLTDFLDPILKDGASCVYGAWKVDGEGDTVFHPCPQGLYLVTPVCHQAFFLTREIYDRVGDYDSSLRCYADCKLMWQVHASGVQATVVDRPVILSQPGGLSESYVKFINEKAVEWHAHLDGIVEKAQRNRDYARAVIIWYCSRCGLLRHHCPMGRQHVPEMLQQFAEIGTALYTQVPCGGYTAKVLKHVVHKWLPLWVDGGSAGKWDVLRFHLLCAGLPLPKSEPYRSMSYILPVRRKLAKLTRPRYKGLFTFPYDASVD